MRPVSSSARHEPRPDRRFDAMVKALRQHVPGGKLRYAIPEGGLYLWCQLPPQVRAKDVQRHAFRDRVVFVPGEAFYVDRGGAHELRVCYSSQPPERAIEAARAIAKGIVEAERDVTNHEPVLVSLA